MLSSQLWRHIFQVGTGWQSRPRNKSRQGMGAARIVSYHCQGMNGIQFVPLLEWHFLLGSSTGPHRTPVDCQQQCPGGRSALRNMFQSSLRWSFHRCHSALLHTC